MDQQEERQIIGRVQSGQREVYALLIEVYKGPIFNLAFRMTGNYQDADDLTQETFITAYQKIQQFDRDKKFFTWLYTIGINLIRNHLKKKARDISSPAVHLRLESHTQVQESREGDLLSEESIRRLDEIMQKLPVDLREAIILKFHQDLTFDEIAAITGDSLSAVKMRIYRGLEKLKFLMNKQN